MRTRKRALWLATESTYGTDPSANGSGYVLCPTMKGALSFKDGLKIIDTDQYTNTNFPTVGTAGPDGWTLEFEVPLSGLSTAAGDGTNASTVTNDYLDLLMQHITTTIATTVGEGVGAASTTSTLILDTDVYDAQHLAPVFEAAVPTGAVRTQWALINIDAGPTYTGCTPTMDQAPTTAAVAYGTKFYLPSDDGGASLAFVYRRDTTAEYTLLGGRITAASMIGELNGVWRLKLTVRGDSITRETIGATKTALPAITVFSRFLKVQLSPLWFNNVKYATSKIEIDLGITAAELGSTAGTNGRAGDDSIQIVPKVMVVPQFTTALEDLKRNVTTGRLLVQMGSGVLSGGVLNTCAFHIDQASTPANDEQDDNGRTRIGLEFMTSTGITHSAGAAVRHFQFARA